MLIRKFKKEEEKKLIDSTVNMAALVGGTMQFQGLVYSQQGNTKTTRIGNKINLESLAWRGYIGIATNETAGALIRVLLVMDRKPEGGQAPATEMLTTEAVESLYNTDEAYQGRFQFLYDKTFVLTDQKNQFIAVKGFIPFNGRKVSYNGNAGTVADIMKNNLFFAIITAGNDQNASASIKCRVRFTDA